MDIFFVISGFLISSIIFSNLERNTFTLSGFYARRILRIFPSLITVLMATLAFGWISLVADEYMQLGKHVAGGSIFISNLLLWNESGYFDRSAHTKPLLHLWSLGIEEQFYIFYPLVLWCAWKLRLNLTTIIMVIIISSFTFNILIYKSNPTEDFYSPLTRLWELLFGSFAAYSITHNVTFIAAFKRKVELCLRFLLPPPRLEQDTERLNDFQSALGALLTLIGVIFTRNNLFPGFFALIPTIGALLIIQAGNQAYFNRVILSNGVLIWIGLISFPLYLWHWPLFSYATILFGDTPPSSVRTLIVFVSIILAWGTYILVEKPIRNGTNGREKAFSLTALMFIIGCIGYAVFSNNGLSNRYPVNENDYAIRGWHLKGDGVIDCGDIVKSTTSSFCATTEKPNVAIIGDSHAGHLFYGFTRNPDKDFNQAIVIGAGSCQPTLNFDTREGCNNQLGDALRTIRESQDIKYVVLAGYYGFIENAESETGRKYLEGLQATINELKFYGKELIYFIDNPSLKESAERCQPHSLKIRNIFNTPPPFCITATSNDFRDQGEYKKLVNMLKANNKDVYFYDPTPLICRNGECNIYDNGKLLYGDWNHLSIYGSQLVVNDFTKAFKK